MLTLPRPDGSFEPELAAYLSALAKRRRSVMFAFPPKSGGTFLRAAAIAAVNGQLARVVHAQGGRDATPYLPTYIHYLSDGYPRSTLVAHVHMQAFPANRHLIEALDLRPVIMLRSVPDMLVSYLDMLEAEPPSPGHWLNMAIPQGFYAMDAAARVDFLIDMIAPWYASYFATWLDYVQVSPARVCVLTFGQLKADAAGALSTALAHSGLSCSPEVCELGADVAWRERAGNRFNRGEQGRGGVRMSAAQLGRIETQLFRHYDLEPWRSHIMPVAA